MKRQCVHQPNFGKCILISVLLICLHQMNGAEMSDVSNKIDLNCSYGYGDGPFYGCLVYTVNLTTNAEIASVTGSHLPGKSNKKVAFIQFVNGTMFFIPSGLGAFFENVWMIMIGDRKAEGSLKTKFISRSGFMNWNNLVEVAILSYDTLAIDENAFIDLPLLGTFGLFGNGSTIFHENAFQNNEKLGEIIVEDTHLEPLHKNIFRNNSLLWRIELNNCSLKTIHENLFERNARLFTVSLRSNKIEHLPRNLFENNLNLREVDFSKNALKTIEIDFKTLHKIGAINLKDNSCISLDCEYDSSTLDEYRLSKLNEFQKEINSNCSVQH